MSLVPRLTGALWRVGSAGRRRAFDRGCADVESAQRAVLADIVARNAATRYGRRHGFASCDSAESFSAHVPLVEWDDLEGEVEAIAAGEPGVLTAEPVVHFEPTSGTSGSVKLVPVTRALRRAFADAAGVWIADALTAFPAAARGRAYWSVTPLGDVPQRTSGGIPVGFEEDAEYFGRLRRALVRATSATPSGLASVGDLELARYATLLALLAAADLSLVSVWNPTFLTLLLARIPEWGPRLVTDLRDGGVSGPHGGSAPSALADALPPRPRRAAEVAEALEMRGDDPAALHRALWPGLALVSCWTDAHAAEAAHGLRSVLRHPEIQGKGLLATEAFVSLPVAGASDPVLAANTHFFEFAVPGSDETVPAWLVQRDARYSVVVTTQGGLYRYRLRDLVEVTGFCGSAPTVRFLGKETLVSDHVGEKVSEAHAGAALRLVRDAGLSSPFSMVSCETGSDGRPGYVVFAEVSDDRLLDPDGACRLVETSLSRNPHYRYARGLGQLGPVRLVLLGSGAADVWLHRHVSDGTRAGDVKPTALDRRGGWLRVFDAAGLVVEEHVGAAAGSASPYQDRG